jgi:hypothetical protein
MTMATVNLLLGMLSPFFALGVGLGALAYAMEGIRRSGFLRRWNLFVAVLLGVLAYGSFAVVGQDFARASDRALISTPADLPSLVAIVICAVVSCAVVVAGATSFRGLFRSSS